MIYDVRNLRFAYPGQDTLLENVSFTLGDGEIVTLLGRNGAGKSTLLSCMLGELRPLSGEILLNGELLSSMSRRQIARSVGFVPQIQSGNFAFTVLDYVMMGCACGLSLFDRPGKNERSAAEAALEELGIGNLADRLFPQLSGGEQQLCAIARAIVRHPGAILLDEPAAHLDVPNRVRLLRIISKLSDRGYGVMLTTHDPDHALVLRGSTLLFEGNGSVSCGDTEETVTEEHLRGVYGNELRIVYLEQAGRRVCVCPGL